MIIDPPYNELQRILNNPADAQAIIKGSSKYPNIRGTVEFYQMMGAVLLVVQVDGLPQSSMPCAPNIYGFHIHEGSSCTGTTEDPFANTDGHFNPTGCPHPAHAGDLPPLFGNNGYAFMIVMTNRFSVNTILGRTVVVHANRDDFTSQYTDSQREKCITKKEKTHDNAPSRS